MKDISTSPKDQNGVNKNYLIFAEKLKASGIDNRHHNMLIAGLKFSESRNKMLSQIQQHLNSK